MKGRITFTSSNDKLNRGFAWAKEQALSYSHEGDLVGDWYEAALPGRMSFCIRDVAHHAVGAEMLGGFADIQKNMLRRLSRISQRADNTAPSGKSTEITGHVR